MAKQLYPKSLATELLKRLKAAPHPDPKHIMVTKSEIISIIADRIREMQGQGYTLSNIADLITKGGLDLRESTLKTYLKRISKGTHQGKNPSKTGKGKVMNKGINEGTNETTQGIKEENDRDGFLKIEDEEV